MKRRYVLKVGGSLLFDNTLKLREDVLNEFAEIIKQSSLISAIVIGGGKLARTYINAARALGSGEALCDTFGIRVSRLNALLLITALGNSAYPEPITSIEEARRNELFGKVLISGGFVPGQSTTSVAFQIAEAIGTPDLLILTNVDGIYDKDPNSYNDAKKYDEINLAELERVIYGEGGENQSAAGEYRIFDAVSFQIMKRSNINVRLMNGENHQDLKRILVEADDSSNIGTRILKN